MPYQSTLLVGVAALAVMAIAGSAMTNAMTGGVASPPETLEQTGLYTDFAGRRVDPANRPFTPQYPLWTDGAGKQRWVFLPAGAIIDASDPEAWDFPVGTRFWKQFNFGGRPVETRYIERLQDGRWLFASYLWAEDGSVAVLASARGVSAAYDLGGGVTHAVPSVTDCTVCHMGGAGPVLGFSALQLSSDRDPGALHGEPPPQGAVDLETLDRDGLISGLAAGSAPRIAAADAGERAALGYLHGNCGHCHNDRGPLASLGLFLRQPARGDGPGPGPMTAPVRGGVPGLAADAVLRIDAGHPERSALLARMASRVPALQMPPLGTGLVDDDAIALLRDWIAAMDTGATEPKED